MRTTVIDERDFIRGLGYNKNSFEGSTITKFDDAGTFTFTAYNRIRSSQNIHVHGILKNDKCYTQPLLLPNIPASDPLATPTNSIDKALLEDPVFREECDQATLYHIHLYQEEAYEELKDNTQTLPQCFSNLPYHEYIQENTPLSAIWANTKRMLWHQRLGHPSDYYLFNAHKYVNGVPQFKHEDPIFDKCHTCIRAKQTKEAAGHHSIRQATTPYQGLSIDFSFSGTRSKDKARQEDFVGINGETSWILVSDHFS